MYATLTTLTFKSPHDRTQAASNPADILPQMRQLPGFHALTLIEREAATATMVTLYGSEEEAVSGADRLRPHLTEAVGPHLTGPPERAAGMVLLHG